MAKKLTAFQKRVLHMTRDDGKQQIDKIFVTEAMYSKLEAMGGAGLIHFKSMANHIEFSITDAGREALSKAED